MSRWFPETLRISLAPDQVVVERWQSQLAVTGWRCRRIQRDVLAARSQPARSGWDDSLRALANALDALGPCHCLVTVVLANSLVRYALVPPSAFLNDDETAAVVSHCFQEIYGDDTETWDLRVSAMAEQALQPACGVERRLLDELRALCDRPRLRLRSIQPRLMTVCSEYRAALAVDPAWLVLVEPGNLCLGLIADGGLARLRSIRIGSDWATQLPWLLEREACLAALAEAPGDALLWLRDGSAAALPALDGVRVHPLAEPPIAATADDGTLAMAGG